MTNVAVFGAGRIGRIHATNISALPGVKLKYVCDPMPAAAAEVAQQLSAEVSTIDAVLADKSIGAVAICTPTDSHSDLITRAAAAGKHIFCEKPVDLTIAKVEAVINAAREANVKLQIGFNRRFDHNFKKVRDLIKDGTLGEIQILKITSRDPEPPSAEYAAASGGMFMDMTIHDFDMARFMMGCEPTEVYVAAACLVDPAIGEAGDVDTAVITIKFENGGLCVIDNSRKAVYGYDQRVEAFGSKGKAEIENDAPSTAAWSTKDGVFREKPKYFFLERYMDSFAEEMKQFMSAIINDTETPVVGFDGLQPIKMGLAAKKSVSEGRPVKLSEFI